jgi:HEAT repeat protein
MRQYKIVILPLLWSFLLGSVCRGAEPGDWDDPSWQLLREAHIHRDAASLAAYLREQCGADGDLRRVDTLIRQLGSPDFQEREQASKSLVAIGPAALAALRAVRNDPDAEVAKRAKECLARVGDRRPELTLAAVRVLIRRGGAEAVPALLRLLPYADFEELQDDLWFGLDALTVRQGKLDASLTRALHDPMAVRRAAAACIVGRRGDADQRGAVRKLLADADAEVRLRAAQGLLAAKDASGVPALMALLEGTPIETAWQAEELLRYVAGEEAPHAILGVGAADDRRVCREAWEAWWKEHGPKVDFAKLDGTSRRPGLMLLCDGGLPEEATGRVWLLGCDGVTRWELRKLSYPVDARLMPGGRVLVVERSLEPRVQIPLALPPRKRSPEEGVSMRDLAGKVLWRYRGVSDPTQCQMTPDGHILISGRELVIAEVDKAGQELFRKDFSVTAFPLLFQSMVLPPPLPDPFALKSDTRILVRGPNDKSQAIEWREVEPNSTSLLGLIPVKPPGWTSYYWLSPDGFCRVTDAVNSARACPSVSRVVRYGKQTRGAWESQGWTRWMLGPFHAAALPNGNSLVGGIGRVVELDADGRPLWSSSFEVNAQRVHPCFNRVRQGFDAPRTPLDLTANFSDWLQGLRSKTATVRQHCVDAIRQFDLETVEAASPSLKPLLADPNEAVRDAARRTLGRLNSDVPAAWLRAIRDKDPRVRQDAGEFLTEPYSPTKVVETRIAMLKDSDSAMRQQGTRWSAAESNPSYLEKIIPALIAAFRDDADADVRWSAASSLGRYGAKARDAIPALVAGLKDPDANVRHKSALALSAIDPLDGRVSSALVEAAQAKETDWGAVEALIRSSQYAKEVVPIFVKMLEAKDFKGTQQEKDRLYWGIISSLGRIGPDAKAAVPALCAILRRRQAGLSIPGLSLRCNAAHALGQIGPAAKEAVPDLENAKNEGGPGIEETLRSEAAEALAKIQED